MKFLRKTNYIFHSNFSKQASGFDWSPIFHWIFIRPLLPLPMRWMMMARRSIPYLASGFHHLAASRLNVDVLDAAAIALSLLRKDYKTASLLMLLLNVGETLEESTRKKSLLTLSEQLTVHFDNIWVRLEDGNVVTKAFADLTLEDIVVCRTGSAIPVDGIVVSGEGMVNQASMTGEPLAVARKKGGSVFAGTALEDGEIDVRPTKIGQDTRLNSIVSYIESSEKVKAGVQSRMEHLADRIVPFNFLLAAFVFLVTRNLTQTATVLTVDYNCALRLATPLAILTAIREGTSKDILIKGGRHIETLAEADVAIFDKTGTLTQATPQLTDVVSVAGWSKTEVLKLAACLEEHFPHPISKCIVSAARESQLDHLNEIHEPHIENIVAHGIASTTKGHRVCLGSRHFLRDDEKVDFSCLEIDISRIASEGKSILYMSYDGEPIGVFGVQDPPKPEATLAIAQLKELGFTKVIMLTGDDGKTAKNIAERLGLDEYRSELLPKDKADIVEQYRSQGYKVLMVGDGINDAPALSAANVGVSLRTGTNIAQETADVLINGNDLTALPVAIRLSRKALSRIQDNFVYSVSLNSLFLLGGLVNVLSPTISALLHNGTTLGVCFNSVRGQYFEEKK